MTIGAQRFLAQLLSVFALVAVFLAGGGIYALVAYSVQSRRREIGVRMAIGAAAPDVVSMVLRQSSRWTLAGIAIGLVGSAVTGRLLAGQLYEVEPTDPLTLGAIIVVFAAIAALAAFVPARRAARVDPMAVLRSD